MSLQQTTWPEPIVRVQSLSNSGITAIPKQYIKPPSSRPSLAPPARDLHIPVIDLSNLVSADPSLRSETFGLVSCACREWGFFHVVNHGVDHALMGRAREIWREFFYLPMEMKQCYANAPVTYEGYGSRLGVEKGIKLDWSDYFFLHYLPISMRDQKKWPNLPLSCREVVAEYSNELVKLCEKLMKAFSVSLGLEEDYLQKAFGGEEVGACMRVSFYPKCPQPDLTLGLSPHSDPGGFTILLPDDQVSGLQVRQGDDWVTVKPVPNAFVVNIGDQLQVLSNSKYKSVEHRVIVNSAKERVSLAFFYNPNGNVLIEPAKEFIKEDQPPLYPPMTFNEYRLFIRTRGPCGKSQVESLKSPR
ncbi:jasmonate-induced oxygenase 1-like [Actinidia eriantha]|uniref:jasmonate-induced oxygenase 1-like n=1 Tax=Actinidia eriantha TaxID=165200 RepID=UPI00258ADCA7|nr:jasmonate-induced oxygenase 1-like [Actinidia eriantha]XP_057512380.1 jasmonate-induced oxygenase 1-like [Actinidia eriantha]